MLDYKCDECDFECMSEKLLNIHKDTHVVDEDEEKHPNHGWE